MASCAYLLSQKTVSRNWQRQLYFYQLCLLWCYYLPQEKAGSLLTHWAPLKVLWSRPRMPLLASHRRRFASGIQGTLETQASRKAHKVNWKTAVASLSLNTSCCVTWCLSGRCTRSATATKPSHVRVCFHYAGCHLCIYLFTGFVIINDHPT